MLLLLFAKLKVIRPCGVYSITSNAHICTIKLCLEGAYLHFLLHISLQLLTHFKVSFLPQKMP